MTAEFSPYEGAFFLPEDVTLAEIWIGLHADAVSYQKAGDLAEREAIDENSLSLLRVLADCKAERWAALVEALGATQTGAIALSWCGDAALADVAALYSSVLQAGGALDLHAAAWLAPRFGAQERRLSTLITLAEDDITTLVLLCLGNPAPLVLDVDRNWLAALPEVLKTVLLSRHDPAVSLIDKGVFAPDV